MTTPSPPPAAPPPGGVFDPAGIVWTPVSTGLAKVRRARVLLAAAVVAVVVVVLAVLLSLPVLYLLLVADAAAGAVGWIVIGRQVRAYGYAERADDLLIRHGLMFRALVVVPYGRMQFVDVQAGPLDRAFKVAQVQLYTASAGSDARIPGVGDDEAARLRDRLSSRGQARLAGL